MKLEIQAERVKVKQAQADRERLEKEIGKERERAAKLEGQCDRAQKEIDSLSQQMLKVRRSRWTLFATCLWCALPCACAGY